MKKLSFEEIREIQLEMLGKLHNFCEYHNIRYFLDAGTLLGAIRHKGFIPWDDDVDICMPRADYEKFINLTKNGFCDTLELMLPENNIDPMLKIVDNRTLLIEFPDSINNRIGVYIDVFPKDGIKSWSLSSYVRCKAVYYFGLIYWFNKASIHSWRINKSYIKKTIAFFGRKVMNEKLRYWPLKRINSISTKYTFNESPYVATIIAGGMKNCVPRECFRKAVITRFEYLNLNIPVGWNEYLTKLYGDYMKLPPEDKRIKHDYIAYWK